MIDRFGRDIRYLRLSVTELCNLRCRYCMPEEGVCKKEHSSMLTQEETLMAVRAAASIGIRKIRVTGGEPLVKPNIVAICKGISETEGIEELCLTTNGVRLPELGDELKKAGVDRLNISLDTLNADKYRYITRNGDLKDAVRGIRSALDCGFKKIKINAVLIGGFNDDEIPELAGLTQRYPVDMRFIEMMPMMDRELFGEGAFIPYSTVLEKLPELEPVPSDGGVAKLYRLPGSMGKVGLISPISAHFCAECNRLRLTADGKIRPCLHKCDEYPIKGLDFEGMREQFIAAVEGKPQWHGELSYTARSSAGRSMNRIGG